MKCDRHNQDTFCLECYKLEQYAKYGQCDKCSEPAMPLHVHCPKCGSPPTDHEVRNYDPMFRDGDVTCTKCDTYVRGYDAG